MYPHLTPYGVIMKINREPLPTLTEDILQRDHEFWKQYSKRMTGDIVDYDTPIKTITDWIEKTYLRHDFNGFTGDRKFIHDDDAQKAFSKLRSSIGGIYAWRLGPQCPPQFRPKPGPDLDRIVKEADFTFRQAFAFCPYSPEAVFRYVNLLLQFNRVEDALLIAETCLKLDPYNGQVKGLVDNLKGFRGQRATGPDFQAALAQVKAAIQMNHGDQAKPLLDSIVSHPAADAQALIGAAELYRQMTNLPGMESTLEKLVKVAPDAPEGWYDLARFKASLRKDVEVYPALSRALELSAQRLKQNPKAPDLLAMARKDDGFSAVRATPDFQRLVPPPVVEEPTPAPKK
jgi:tetratricopeptide (TPR) repeat protein